MENIPVDTYRQLLGALIHQSGGRLRVKESSFTASAAGTEIIQAVDEHTGDLILMFEYIMQEA